MANAGRWGRTLAECGRGTIVLELDRAIRRTRAAVASGDRDAIGLALEALYRSDRRHWEIVGNRLQRPRGRSKAAMLAYLRRSLAAVDAIRLALIALGDPKSMEDVAELDRLFAGLRDEVEAATADAAGGTPLNRGGSGI